jgi:lysozyme
MIMVFYLDMLMLKLSRASQFTWMPLNNYYARLSILALTLTALNACSSGPRTSSELYPLKGDVKPHEGVASAHDYPNHGIDVSKWQGDIDWIQVKAAGTKFAFIKATEGGDHLDEKFYQNWAGAKAAGVPRGAYHFVYWCRPAHEQAMWFKNHIPSKSQSDSLTLPPVLDVEWNGHSKTCPTKVPRDVALEKIRLMLRELEEHTGQRPIIYTDITFHNEVLVGEFNDYPFWLRSVAAKPEERYVGNRKWSYWQYTTTGRIPGIKGNVDRNVGL